MRRALPLLILLAAAACLALAGPTPIAKLALLAGRPGLAARLAEDPGVRGVALYRAGRYAEADAAFTAAGRDATYNRGLSLAVTGDLALAVAYFDAVLFAAPEDRAVRQDRAVVAALVPPVVGAGDGIGRIAAIAAAAAPPLSRADLNWGLTGRPARKPLTAQSVAASDGWLETLSDSPGEYLRKRLRAEHDRRAEQGLVVEHPASPW